MSRAEEVKLHIKVVINKEKTKVLFAEVGSDFADVLLSFLVLPLTTIVEVLEKHYGGKVPVIGSLNTLYKGVTNLDIVYFNGENRKNELINSTRFENELRKLRINIRGTQAASLCSGKLYDGVFTQSLASFILSDDLCLLPNVAGSIVETLSTLGIAVEDMDGVETRNVTLGMNEIIALLKESLISLNPLTALIFPGRQMTVETEKDHVLLHQIDQKAIVMSPQKMILKVMLQKSTNKLLFAQAYFKFVDKLFSLLTVPLGRVEWYYGSNTGLKNIDNLHRSVADNPKNMHLKDNKDLLSESERSEVKSHVREERMYMVRDDLTVSLLGVTSVLSVINEWKISWSDIKEVKLEIGFEELLNIRKAALTSTTALTDGLIKPFLKNQEMEQ